MYSYRCNMTAVYVTLDWVLWMWGGICLTNESRGTNLRSALILGLIAVNAFQWRLRRRRQPHAETRWIHSSLPLLSFIMKFYSSARAWRLRNIKDIVPAQLQMNSFIHTHPLLQSAALLSLFPLLLHLRPQNPFSCPSLLDILISLNKCITFIQVFLPLFFPLSSQELIDTWTQQEARNQSPAATDKTACAS